MFVELAGIRAHLVDNEHHFTFRGFSYEDVNSLPQLFAAVRAFGPVYVTIVRLHLRLPFHAGLALAFANGAFGVLYGDIQPMQQLRVRMPHLVVFFLLLLFGGFRQIVLRGCGRFIGRRIDLLLDLRFSASPFLRFSFFPFAASTCRNLSFAWLSAGYGPPRCRRFPVNGFFFSEYTCHPSFLCTFIHTLRFFGPCRPFGPFDLRNGLRSHHFRSTLLFFLQDLRQRRRRIGLGLLHPASLLLALLFGRGDLRQTNPGRLLPRRGYGLIFFFFCPLSSVLCPLKYRTCPAAEHPAYNPGFQHPAYRGLQLHIRLVPPLLHSQAHRLLGHLGRPLENRLPHNPANNAGSAGRPQKEVVERQHLQNAVCSPHNQPFGSGHALYHVIGIPELIHLFLGLGVSGARLHRCSP